MTQGAKEQAVSLDTRIDGVLEEFRSKRGMQKGGLQALLVEFSINDVMRTLEHRTTSEAMDVYRAMMLDDNTVGYGVVAASSILLKAQHMQGLPASWLGELHFGIRKLVSKEHNSEERRQLMELGTMLNTALLQENSWSMIEVWATLFACAARMQQKPTVHDLHRSLLQQLETLQLSNTLLLPLTTVLVDIVEQVEVETLLSILKQCLITVQDEREIPNAAGVVRNVLCMMDCVDAKNGLSDALFRILLHVLNRADANELSSSLFLIESSCANSESVTHFLCSTTVPIRTHVDIALIVVLFAVSSDDLSARDAFLSRLSEQLLALEHTHLIEKNLKASLRISGMSTRVNYLDNLFMYLLETSTNKKETRVFDIVKLYTMECYSVFEFHRSTLVRSLLSTLLESSDAAHFHLLDGLIETYYASVVTEPAVMSHLRDFLQFIPEMDLAPQLMDMLSTRLGQNRPFASHLIPFLRKLLNEEEKSQKLAIQGLTNLLRNFPNPNDDLHDDVVACIHVALRFGSCDELYVSLAKSSIRIDSISSMLRERIDSVFIDWRLCPELAIVKKLNASQLLRAYLYMLQEKEASYISTKVMESFCDPAVLALILGGSDAEVDPKSSVFHPPIVQSTKPCSKEERLAVVIPCIEVLIQVAYDMNSAYWRPLLEIFSTITLHRRFWQHTISIPTLSALLFQHDLSPCCYRAAALSLAWQMEDKSLPASQLKVSLEELTSHLKLENERIPSAYEAMATQLPRPLFDSCFVSEAYLRDSSVADYYEAIIALVAYHCANDGVVSDGFCISMCETLLRLYPSGVITTTCAFHFLQCIEHLTPSVLDQGYGSSQVSEVLQTMLDFCIIDSSRVLKRLLFLILTRSSTYEEMYQKSFVLLERYAIFSSDHNLEQYSIVRLGLVSAKDVSQQRFHGEFLTRDHEHSASCDVLDAYLVMCKRCTPPNSNCLGTKWDIGDSKVSRSVSNLSWVCSLLRFYVCFPHKTQKQCVSFVTFLNRFFSRPILYIFQSYSKVATSKWESAHGLMLGLLEEVAWMVVETAVWMKQRPDIKQSPTGVELTFRFSRFRASLPSHFTKLKESLDNVLELRTTQESTEGFATTVSAAPSTKKRKKRLRSRNAYIDAALLEEESGDDCYADLEDFIV